MTREIPGQQNDERFDFRAPIITKTRDVRKQERNLKTTLPPVKKFNNFTQFYRG